MDALLDHVAGRFGSNGEASKDASLVRLNLGAGDLPLDGYVPIDRKTGDEVFPLNYPDESVYVVRASHVLEHLPRAQTIPALRDWARVLKPGGCCKIAVPDFDVIVRMHAAGQRGYEQYLMGGQVDDDDYHRTIWTENKLRMLMRNAGLRRVRRWVSEIKDCAALAVSLNLEGFKPEPVDVQSVQVVMSRARYVLSSTFTCVVNACQKLGMKQQEASGPYWQQGLTNALEHAIADGAEFVLVVDGDTVFDPDDVAELYRLIAGDPTIDAIAPIQMARGMPGPLATIAGDDGKPLANIPAEWFDRDLLKCRSAHFGLTILRSESFAKMPKPWFVGIPAPDGGWGDGRIDADVNFWLKWNDVGNSLYLAPLVCVGHVEEVVLHPSRQLTTIVQDAGEYRREGPPVEALR